LLRSSCPRSDNDNAAPPPAFDAKELRAARAAWRLKARQRRLSPRARLLVDYLATLKSFPHAFFRVSKLAEELCCSSAQARRTVREVERAGLLAHAPYYGSIGEQRANDYLACDGERWCWRLLGGDELGRAEGRLLVSSLLSATWRWRDEDLATSPAVLEALLRATGAWGLAARKCKPPLADMTPPPCMDATHSLNAESADGEADQQQQAEPPPVDNPPSDESDEPDLDADDRDLKPDNPEMELDEAQLQEQLDRLAAQLELEDAEVAQPDLTPDTAAAPFGARASSPAAGDARFGSRAAPAPRGASRGPGPSKVFALPLELRARLVGRFDETRVRALERALGQAKRSPEVMIAAAHMLLERNALTPASYVHSLFDDAAEQLERALHEPPPANAPTSGQAPPRARAAPKPPDPLLMQVQTARERLEALPRHDPRRPQHEQRLKELLDQVAARDLGRTAAS